MNNNNNSKMCNHFRILITHRENIIKNSYDITRYKNIRECK